MQWSNRQTLRAVELGRPQRAALAERGPVGASHKVYALAGDPPGFVAAGDPFPRSHTEHLQLQVVPMEQDNHMRC